MTRSTLPPEAALNDLLRILLDDRAAGRERTLAEYQALFPGHEALVAREFGEQPDPRAEAAGEQHFGPYRLLHPLGRGGQGQVWLAVDTRLGRTVALKVLDQLGISKEALERFRREAQIASRLDDPGICAVYEAGSADGVPYMAMRYVAGRSLSDLLEEARRAGAHESSSVYLPAVRDEEDVRGAPLDVARVLRLVERLARSIHAAHEHGVVHRDVKPGNVIVGEDGQPVILDFGLAQAQDAAFPTVTRTGDVFGTPAYMAPEQIQGGAVDRRADVWALGVILHECLTLTRPFEAPTRESLYVAILTRDPADPRERNAAIRADLALVIATALEKQTLRRYQTALDLAEDVRRVRRGEPIVARPPSLFYRAQRFAARNRALVGGTLAVIVALGIGLGATLRALEVAEESAVLARGETQKVLRLSDVRRLDDLVDESRNLWPADPTRVPDYERWIGEAEALVARLPEHRERLAELRTKAVRSAEQVLPAAPAPPTQEDTAAEARETWHFADAETQWHHGTLEQLVEDLEFFGDSDPHVGRLADVRARLEFARGVEKRSIDDAHAAWEEAIASVRDRSASPAYAGLEMRPQLGLVPIGRDPNSGLQEFAHLQTGTMAPRGPEGRFDPGPEWGLVFVLIPGGKAWIGSQRSEPDGPNYDPNASLPDSPVTEVDFEPFFLSKYEMTQAQWERMTGTNPSQHVAGRTIGDMLVSALHPVEQISWTLADETLRNLGLVMPSDAQWEYAARAGTDTIWATGNASASLAGSANLADAYCHAHGGPPTWSYEMDIDDGHLVHAPVGSFTPNRFGLHDVHGNVWEWCQHDREHAAARIDVFGDSNITRSDPRTRVHRGGGYDNTASQLRVGLRYYALADFRRSMVGVRPARALVR